jgi:sec-independent protein translocase protein TatA
MGMSGIGVWELFLILMIILLLFGTKKLRSIGADLGSAVRGFRNSLHDEEPPDAGEAQTVEHKREQANKMESSSQKNQSDADFKVKSGNETK